ncbi:sulfite exporter TauE/SafE family protein [Thermodesulfatator atlanticus]|uniref:sulfite exporter TauE/SafE family protein n=1 Tax=Thermodesulfatator atlanticus TaxID=501497 RepID=UPI0003B44D32|nr:sulfite exporter TauE/SafE family protein [Thermodesulfatator atlanticus]
MESLKKFRKFLMPFFIFLVVAWIYCLYSGVQASEEAQKMAAEAQKAAAQGAVAAKAAAGAQACNVLLNDDLGLKGKLGKIIAKTPVCTPTCTTGCIDPNAPKGYLGIPGGPKPSPIGGLLWAIWVGWIFSTVGAFGGIMAGVGHITIFGLANFAKSFKKTNPALNKFLTDTIRVSNMFLVGLSALVSAVNYWKMKRIVWPLAIALAVGAVGGAFGIAELTAGKISLKAYIGYFGLAVFAVAGFMFYGTTERARAKRKAAREAAKRFEEAAKKGDAADGVKVVSFGLTNCVFTFYGVEFRFNPLLAAFGGLVIATIAVFLGIGGGFLLVPFMTDIVKLPMFIVAGTSAFVVLIKMIMGICTYMLLKGVQVWWPLIGTELVGIFIGSMIGPRTQKYIPDIWLKRLFVVLAIYVGLRYTSKGFLGKSIVPPY